MSSTFARYLAQIQEETRAPGIYAYRGQQHSQWSLNSAATRRLNGKNASDTVLDPEFLQLYVKYHREALVEPARTRGFGSELGRRLSDLQLLAKLQHLGTATGLLDFSWSPLVAMWFACQDSARDGKIFIVDTNDPIRVAKISSDESTQDLGTIFSGIADPSLFSYWEPMATGDAAPRILRQRSVFIIGRPLLPVDGKIVREIVIDKADKEPLLTELRVLDIHQDSLFQDVYGFAQLNSEGPVPVLGPDIYRINGNRHYQQGEYPEAIVAYGEAIKLAPDVSTTYFLRGNALAASGRHQEALDDYDRAVIGTCSIHGSIQDTMYYNRGNCRAELEDYEGALCDYTEAISLNPNYPHFYYNRGNTFLDLYRFCEALRDYDQVTGHTSRNAVFNRGNALLSMGGFSEARLCYQNAAEMGADHDGIKQNLWTLEQVMLLVNESEYTVMAAPDPNTGTMCLRFGVPERKSNGLQELNRFLFFGRVGNAGNTGGPRLSGGKRFDGKPFIGVYVDVLNASEDSHAVEE